MIHKVRVHEIAKEVGIKSKDVIEKAQEVGLLDIKAANSAVSSDVAEKLINYIMKGINEFSNTEEKPSVEKKVTTKQKDIAEEKKEAKTELLNETQVVKQKEIESNKTDKQTEQVVEEKAAEEKKEVGIWGDIKNSKRLTIVKKRRDIEKTQEDKKKLEQIKIEEKEKKVSELSLEQKLTTEQSKLESKKKKKIKKVTTPTKKESTKKIDISDVREFKDDLPMDDDEVVLMDFSVNEYRKKDETKLDENRIKITKQTIDISGGTNQLRRVKSKKPKITPKIEKQNTITIPEEVRVYEFAEIAGISVKDVITKLFKLGLMVTKNDFLEKDVIEILAEEFEIDIQMQNVLDELDYIQAYEQNSAESEDENLQTRPPVVTIMGHVDHGKTSLLDKIRNAKVADGEAGGITQHIGAYMIQKDGKNITFIDTPGHEAFTQMRARGAMATDIVVIVVAADDGVKPQTIEAISHAKASGAPIIVAVNKIDKPDANVDMVKSQMSEQNLMPLEWGGDTEFAFVSAKTGEGIDDLLDIILIQSEIMELKANPKDRAKAVVVESSQEKGKGALATVIVKNGTLKVGDSIVADTTYGRVKALIDDRGKNLKELKPGEPGVVMGLNDVPPAGSILVAVSSDKDAREYAEKRAEYKRRKELSHSTKASFEELTHLIKEGQIKSLPIILKADVQGSLEAIKGSLEKLKNEEVKVNIVHSGIGGINESDITLAGASQNCFIVGFNVRPTGSVKNKAKSEGIEIKTYNVIYDLIDDVKSLLSGMMSPVVKEEVSGQAQVRQVFNIAKVGTVAGCIVTDGSVTRGGMARLIRDGVVVYTTKISSLKRFKDDAKEVAKGYECGIMLENFNDIKEGDFIETFKQIETSATL